MPYKPNTTCLDCDEKLEMHGTQKPYLCRYERPGWISLREELPPQDTEVLVKRRKQVLICRYVMACELNRFSPAGVFIFGSTDIVHEVTHWRPLPKRKSNAQG